MIGLEERFSEKKPSYLLSTDSENNFSGVAVFLHVAVSFRYVFERKYAIHDRPELTGGEQRQQICSHPVGNHAPLLVGS